MTQIEPRPLRLISVARGHTEYAWWHDRLRGWAINPLGLAIRPNRGSRWTVPRRPCSSNRPQVGSGANSGKVAIAWRASDLHLPPKSVSLSWRPDQPGSGWQPLAEGLDNIGQYVWTVPATVPPRFHLKVEATDTVGHHGTAETTDMGAVTVDRSRPRSRIIGLDPNARAGIGPAAGSFR